MDPSTTLPLSVTMAVLAAAITHATWNAIAHGIKDQMLAFGLIGAGGILVAIPLVIVAAAPRPDCWPYLLGSVAIHVFYNLLLMRCYRYGEFGQVYPLARGISPPVVTVLAAVFVGEHLALHQIAGVVIVSAGLAALVFVGRWPGRVVMLAAVGTGLTIAAYTTVDGVGVRLAASPVGYIGWLMLLQSMCVPMFALLRRRDVLARQRPRVLVSGLAAALPDLFSPAILALIRLVIARDELRARLRAATGSRIPLLSESTAMIAGYLAAERDLGRVAADADIGTLAPTLIGAAATMTSGMATMIPPAPMSPNASI